jgi:hypothetical protein
MSAEHDLHHTPHPQLLRQFRHLGAQMLADAAPVTTDEVVTPNTEPADDALLRPRMADIPLEPASELIRSGPSPGRRRGALIGAAAAASLLVVGLGVARRSGDGGAPEPVGATAAAPSREPAATSATGTAPSTVAAPPDGDPETLAWPPRLLLDATWNITDASERSLDEGGMSFVRDDRTVWVNWYRDPIGASGDSLDREAVEGYEAAGTATVLGASATIFELTNPIGPEGRPITHAAPTGPPGPAVSSESSIAPQFSNEELMARIVSGNLTVNVQLRAAPGTTLDVGEFSSILASLHQVEAAEWEAALPDDVVTFAERPATVDELLAGVPVTEPALVDQIRVALLVQSRTELANRLLQAVVCGWLNEYLLGHELDDADAVAAAGEVIASVAGWPVTRASSDETYSSLTVRPDGTIIYDGTGEPINADNLWVFCDSGVG